MGAAKTATHLVLTCENFIAMCAQLAFLRAEFAKLDPQKTGFFFFFFTTHYQTNQKYFTGKITLEELKYYKLMNTVME